MRVCVCARVYRFLSLAFCSHCPPVVVVVVVCVVVVAVPAAAAAAASAAAAAAAEAATLHATTTVLLLLLRLPSSSWWELLPLSRLRLMYLAAGGGGEGLCPIHRFIPVSSLTSPGIGNTRHLELLSRRRSQLEISRPLTFRIHATDLCLYILTC